VSNKVGGFFLGAVIPLERVGFVLAEMYESQGCELKIQQVLAADMAQMNGHQAVPEQALPLLAPQGRARRPRKGEPNLRELALNVLKECFPNPVSRASIFEAVRQIRSVAQPSVDAALHELVVKGLASRPDIGMYAAESVAKAGQQNGKDLLY
jgi:hypothetical protein